MFCLVGVVEALGVEGNIRSCEEHWELRGIQRGPDGENCNVICRRGMPNATRNMKRTSV
jgi:hypothetical protein